MGERGTPISVECYAGYQAEQEPRAFTLHGERRVVLGIADRWRDPAADYFKVRGDDGHQYLIGRDRERDVWFLIETLRTDA